MWEEITMSSPKSELAGSELVLESSVPIASLLRSLANPYRVKILAVAMRGDGEVSEMAAATGLSRTALANHISQLIRTGLIRRRERGKYELTPDGRELLSASLLAYRRSKRRIEQEKEMIRRSYGLAFGEAHPSSRRTISADVQYESCWLSLLGAVSGSLKALGVKTDVTDVGGFTGYTFLINVSRGETCPSGPTALHVSVFTEILRGIECLGWRVQNREYPHSYPGGSGHLSLEDLKVARDVFERVKREIDRNDRPVVLYGLAAPEYGIVRGYSGDSYIVSTFRSLLDPGVEEEPVPYHKLNAPGCIDEIYFAERVKIRPSKARKEALSRALRFAEGRVETLSNYVSGPSALEEWASVLEELPQASQNYMGNSYVGACVHEGRGVSSAFLRRMSKHFSSPESAHLLKASNSYRRGAKPLSEFTKLFPFGFEGKMPASKRRRGADLLREAQSHEEKAIQHLSKVA